MFQAKIKLFEVINVSGNVDEKMMALGKDIKITAKKKGQTYSKGEQFWNRITQTIDFIYDKAAKTLIYGSNHAVAAHKQYGGTISAPGKWPGSRDSNYLTIPISPISEGKDTSFFRKAAFKTFFFTSKKGNLILGMTTKKDGLQPLFVLKKSVTQKAQPYFPEGIELENLIKKDLNGELKK